MAIKHKPYGGVYENFDFEKVYGPKQWVEFPKAVPTGKRGEFQIVNSVAEENALLAKMQHDEDSAPAYVEPYVSDPEKDILISRCRELGLAFNAKWSKAKLKATVETAEMDVDNLPAEEVTPKKKVVAIQPKEVSMTSESVDEIDEKSELLARAKELGIKGAAMHLWGIPRLKAAIAEAE